MLCGTLLSRLERVRVAAVVPQDDGQDDADHHVRQ
jgi:hypothetical protein